MIDHTGVAATNYAKSKQFYTQALAPLGYQLMMELPKEVTSGIGVAGFGVPPKPDFWLHEHATANNPPVHIAFRADSRALVDAFYKAAMAAGGRDNGAPGAATALPRELLRRVRARSRRQQHRSGLSHAVTSRAEA